MRDLSSAMDSETFRRHAHGLVDWMANYMDGVERYPVRAQVKPGEIAARLPLSPPREGEAIESIFRDFERDLLPGVTHWQHPSFFAYFPANASPPSILAEMLTATLGLQCMMWQTSPAATELEARVMEWLRQMLGLPDGFTGVIQDSASSATLCSILTARERATDWRANEVGVGAHKPMTVYCSAETHSSIEKAVGIIGIGRANLRKVPVDLHSFAMRPDALDAAIVSDLAAGRKPICVVATLGSTGAVMCVDKAGFLCVGQEINANHVRSARRGQVTGTARPVHIGGRSHVWAIEIVNDEQDLVCVSRLTIAIVKVGTLKK